MRSMRTTVTLDPDVEAKLRAIMRERGISFKEALNNSIRAGVANVRGPGTQYQLKTYPMGLRPGIQLTKALALGAELEDEEIVRKLELRK
jgi:hypothetical protein